MQQHEYFEDLNAALSHVINATGGPKAVGCALWPSLAPDAAGRKIAHCLEPHHAQKFSPDEVLWLLVRARQADLHSAMGFMCRAAGYAEPQPIEPADQAADLQRRFLQGVKDLEQIRAGLERLLQPAPQLRVAGRE